MPAKPTHTCMTCGVSLETGPINLPLLCDRCVSQPLRDDFNRGLSTVMIELNTLHYKQQLYHSAVKRERLILWSALLCLCLGLVLKSLGL